jgi:hypothetical protein
MIIQNLASETSLSVTQIHHLWDKTRLNSGSESPAGYLQVDPWETHRFRSHRSHKPVDHKPGGSGSEFLVLLLNLQVPAELSQVIWYIKIKIFYIIREFM